MKKTISSAAWAAVAALALAFAPVLLAQTSSGTSTMDKNDSKNGKSETLDANVNQNPTDSALTSTTKTPSDATTSPVEQKQANENPSGATASTGKAEKPLSDKEFVLKASQGGMTEVELGRLASDKGGTSQVKDFGSRMIKDHSQANDELKGLAEKKGIALDSKLDARHQSQVDRLSKLSGPAFDKAYVTNQVRAHEGTVELFKEEAKSGQDPDLKAFASRTLPTLENHRSSIMDIQKSGVK